MQKIESNCYKKIKYVLKNLKLLPQLKNKGVDCVRPIRWDLSKLEYIEDDKIINGILPEIQRDTKRVFVNNCPSLITALNLHEGIRVLEFRNNLNLENIRVPQSVIHLDLFGCNKLKAIQDLPEGLQFLSLTGCNSLEQTQELTVKLLELDRKGCDVQYPDHFIFSSEAVLREERLAGIISSYAEKHPELPRPRSTTELLHRFLTEGIEDRGGVAGILIAVDVVLDVVQRNPDHLEWIEDVAAAFVKDGCINQPVAGWSEISALASIAQKGEIKDKIEAATHIMALEKLKEYVVNSQKPLTAAQPYFDDMWEVKDILGVIIDEDGQVQVIEISDPETINVVRDKFIKIYEFIKDQDLGDGLLDNEERLVSYEEMASYYRQDILQSIPDSLESNDFAEVFQRLGYAYTEFMNQYLKPGVEVEGINALLREVHKKLLLNGDIKEPWLGIPNKVRFETVSGIPKWFDYNKNENKVEIAYNLIKNSVLNKTTAEKAAYLCETHHLQSWGLIAFPMEVEKIKEDYSVKMDELSENPNYTKEQADKLLKERDEAIAHQVKRLTDIAVEVNEFVTQGAHRAVARIIEDGSNAARPSTKISSVVPPSSSISNSSNTSNLR